MAPHIYYKSEVHVKTEFPPSYKLTHVNCTYHVSVEAADFAEGCDTLGESQQALPSGPEPQNLVYEPMGEQAFPVLYVPQVGPTTHACLHYNLTETNN
jgi:hypothetical protein